MKTVHIPIFTKLYRLRVQRCHKEFFGRLMINATSYINFLI